MDDPTVGWLVVVDGPGKGQVRRLGYGVNSLGRGGKSRVKLDFGDERSRARITPRWLTTPRDAGTTSSTAVG